MSAYAEMCEDAKESDIWGKLKEKYHFSGTSEISAEMAEKIITQVEVWYKGKKNKIEGA